MAGRLEAAEASFDAVLDDTARQLEVGLSDTQRDQLIRYVALLSQWNATYNLTAVREPRDMLTQHVVDCLAVIPPLRREAAKQDGRRLLDVGSGAGLPGIVIAIVAPEFEVTCVDSVGKKAAFIAHAAHQLGLSRLIAKHDRVENCSGPYDVITSRAFASLASFVRSSRHLLENEGAWMAMKGRDPAAELSEAAESGLLFHVEQLIVPGLAADRCLVWIRHTEDASTY